MTLPHVLKRIRLNLARSKEFPSGSTKHGYEFVAPLTAKGISIRTCGKSTVNIVACEGSGMARTSKLAIWSISREGRSMPAGCLITTQVRQRTTKLVIVSACTHFYRANTSRFGTSRASCTRFK